MVTKKPTPAASTRTKAVGYIRVSTEQQTQSGLSLDGQRLQIVRYAELYNIELVDILVDASASARTLNRPALTQALKLLNQRKASALIVSKLDRLTRSVRDLDHLLETYFMGGQFALLSVNDQLDTRSANGRLIINFLAMVSQWEREVNVERTVAALNVKRERGERTGSVPIGKRVAPKTGTKLLDNPIEQAAIARAQQLRSEGWRYRAIARYLDLEGFPTRSGRYWHPQQIKRMVEGAAKTVEAACGTQLTESDVDVARIAWAECEEATCQSVE